jgi:ATP-binding cassette, subfamily B, bacterial
MHRSGGVGRANRLFPSSQLAEHGKKRPDAATVRRVARFFVPYRKRVALSVFLILLTAGIGLVNPILLKLIIDDAIAKDDLDKLYLYVGLMIVLPILSGLIGVGQTWLNVVIGQRVMSDLRERLYAHLQQLALRFFTETRTGEIQSRLSNDVGGIQRVVTETATSIVSNFAVALSTIIAMWLLDWRLALLSLAMLPVFAGLTYKVGKARRELTSSTQRSMADLTSILEETLSVSGVLLTKAFGRQIYETERFRDENKRLAGFQVREQMIGRWFFMIIGTFFSIMPAFVYLVAGRNIIGGGSMTVGSIVAFTTLQSRLFFPLGQLLNIQVEIQGAFALFDRIFEYLDLPVTLRNEPGAVTLHHDDVQGRVAFRNVSFRYDRVAEDKEGDEDAQPFTLTDISFEAEPGQLVALVGPSGAGKSTISLLIPRLYDVDSGSVEIDGRDVRTITLESLGQLIGMVTQETYLFHSTVRENIAYGKLNATDAEIEAAARAAAIHNRIADLPERYETIVGERGYKLSGGEKQRIALARVILKDPRILILDEATSALDTHSERLIQAAIERLMTGRTTIAIAHRLSTVLAADQILVVDAGRIVERGRHQELLERDGLYARLYREQFIWLDEPMLQPAPVH